MKILVVDDSQKYQDILTSYVTSLGFESVSAINGEEAIDIFTRERPGLIFLDAHLPRMSGYSIARRIRDLGTDWASWAPIIFMSNNLKDEDIVAGIEAGGDDYLAKPINEIVLRAKIRAMKRLADHRLNAIEVAEALSKANKELEHLNNDDALTGIPNKRYFDAYLRQEWFRSIRSKSPLSMLFLDIDHFTAYNDNYGHAQGDICLKEVAQVLSSSIHRCADKVFRYGEEKFSIILPDTDHAGMCHIGETMVQSLRHAKLPHAHSPTADIVTVSASGATFIAEQGQEAEMLVQQADQAVYQAKEEGRNRFISS